MQVCLNGAWGAVCSGGVGYGASNLMCSQLGFQRQGTVGEFSCYRGGLYVTWLVVSDSCPE